MARQGKGAGALKKKGEQGAAKNYITRNQAIKKLQCTLSDFRRLCILKGIYPREPRSRKKANKGSSAPASFYYSKDIQYLLHEPVLGKLREHKAFAKKLSKAVGRGEFGLAKGLEERKPVYRIDHIIKERYPTFTDSLRDLDDALSLIVLFASLPSSSSIPPSIISNCAKLAAQWQLYVLRTKSLKKVFLSIKGVYFQAEVEGQEVNWLVPYMFTQNIPSDLDFRIMLTFLELYQTLLGFVFFKLYTSINLVYPPNFSTVLDENGAGIGALLLEETGRGLVVVDQSAEEEEGSGEAKEKKKVYAKDVRNRIREITMGGEEGIAVEDSSEASIHPTTSTTEDFSLDVFPTPSTTSTTAIDSLPLPPSLTSSPKSSLFSTYIFYISRECTRPTLEFILRSFSAIVSWDPILGIGSPYLENDPRITHHIIDRPHSPSSSSSLQHPGKRVYVQPQWVVDCVNKGVILPTEEYAPGKVLPPHLSPFVDEGEVRERGGYVPSEGGRLEVDGEDVDEEEEEEEEDEEMVDVEEGEGEGEGEGERPALQLAAQDPTNTTLLHAAELEAESLGFKPDQFEKDFKGAMKKAGTIVVGGGEGKDGKNGRGKKEEDMLASIMLTGKQRKLYNKMSYSKERKEEETAKLEKRKKEIEKAKKKKAKTGGL